MGRVASTVTGSGKSPEPSESPAERFERALDGKLPLKLAGSMDGKIQAYQVRLICRDPDRVDAFWAQFVKGDRPAIEKMIAEKSALEAAVTVEGTRLVFQTVPLQRNPRLWVNGTAKVEGLLLTRPEQFEEQQRRSNPRVTVPAGSGVSVKLFRTDAATAGKTAAAGVFKDNADLSAELWDLSRGGACFLCPFAKNIVAITPDEALLVGINYYGTRLVLESRLAYRRTIGGAIRVGVRFVRGPLEGKGSYEALQRIVEEMEGRLHRRLFASVSRKTGVA